MNSATTALTRTFTTSNSGSFELHGMYLATDDSAPGMRDIWDAQLWYWVQEDIVEALARVNDRAAAKLENPWVGNLPIKDVLSIRVSDYVIDAGDAAPATARGNSTELPASHPDEAYTHLASDPLFDVVNVRVRAAVDVRDLLEILDELCHDRYYGILNVGYIAVTPDLDFTGKIYGPEPVVLATIDLQTYLYYKSYVPMMPAPVREQLGISEKDFEKLLEELQPAEVEDSTEPELDEG